MRTNLANQYRLEKKLWEESSDGGLVDSVVDGFVAKFWDWYDDNKDDVIISRGVWFVRVTVTVSDLLPVFVKIFGPRVD